MKPTFWLVFRRRWKQFLCLKAVFYGWRKLYDYYCRTWDIQMKIDASQEK